MAVLSNGLETIEVGATAWRIIINNNLQNLYAKSELYTKIDIDKVIQNVTNNINNGSMFSTVTYAPNINLDMSASANTFYITLTGDVNITPTNLKEGKKGTIIIKQDEVGSRAVTIDSKFKFTSAPTFSTTANYIDSFDYLCIDSNTIICSAVTTGLH